MIVATMFSSNLDEILIIFWGRGLLGEFMHFGDLFADCTNLDVFALIEWDFRCRIYFCVKTLLQ